VDEHHSITTPEVCPVEGVGLVVSATPYIYIDAIVQVSVAYVPLSLMLNI
jgi:hypothetical protein